MSWCYINGMWTTSKDDYTSFVNANADSDYVKGHGAWKVRCPSCRQSLPPVGWNQMDPFFSYHVDMRKWSYTHRCGTKVLVTE